MQDQQTVFIQLTEEQLQIVLKKAAHEGAQQALREIGLHDEEAGKDISDLRNLIEDWRDVRRTVTRTVAKWITMGILGAIALGAWTHWGNGK